MFSVRSSSRSASDPNHNSISSWPDSAATGPTRGPSFSATSGFSSEADGSPSPSPRSAPGAARSAAAPSGAASGSAPFALRPSRSALTPASSSTRPVFSLSALSSSSMHSL